MVRQYEKSRARLVQGGDAVILTARELKQIRLFRQHLTNPAEKLTVVRDLCGMQAQFFSNAVHALRIRCSDFRADTLCEGLVKNWTVRGTVHVFAESDLPLFINGPDYRRNSWEGKRFWNQRDSWALTPERQRILSAGILTGLELSPLTREELKAICRGMGMTPWEEDSMFDPWGGGMRELCERGFINYTVEQEKRFCLAPEFVPMEESEAELEICRRYLTHIAPATVADLCYYLKCTRKQAKNWLSQLPVETVTVDGKPHFYLGELEDCPEVPDCIFLAGFDQLLLAYEKKESIYLPQENMRKIFNLAGIVMPSLLLNGEIAGKWKHQGNNMTVTPFRRLSGTEIKTVKSAAESLWPGELVQIVME